MPTPNPSSKHLFPRLLSATLLLVAGATSFLGCGQTCNAAYFFSGATIELHLPPVASVAGPETLMACRQPTCFTTTLPDLPTGPGHIAAVNFASTPDVVGTLQARSAGVRLLTLDWTVHEPLSANHGNH